MKSDVSRGNRLYLRSTVPTLPFKKLHCAPPETLIRFSSSTRASASTAMVLSTSLQTSKVQRWPDLRFAHALAAGNRTTPSFVAFTESERLVGEAARAQAAGNPLNTIFDASTRWKRLEFMFRLRACRTPDRTQVRVSQSLYLC